jgi:hypothetical protein
MLPWGIAPTQTIAIDEYYSPQEALVIHLRLASVLRREWLQPLICSSVSQKRLLTIVPESPGA